MSGLHQHHAVAVIRAVAVAIICADVDSDLVAVSGTDPRANQQADTSTHRSPLAVPFHRNINDQHDGHRDDHHHFDDYDRV